MIPQSKSFSINDVLLLAASRFFFTISLALGCMHASHAACPPAGESIASLSALKASKWNLETRTGPARQSLALELADCLGSPDSDVRDGLAFEGLQAWMRSGQLATPIVQQLRTRLLADLAAPDDPAGFRKPFAALVLAEVARVDRIKPYLSAEERQDLVSRAAAYLSGVTDYRGFDEKEGWRHGVAHGADLMLQLSLNAQLDDVQRTALLAAIASQVVPRNAHIYRFGEPERLMAPVFYLARSGFGSTSHWEAFFDSLVSRVPKAAGSTLSGLAARHNVAAFLAALYVATRESGHVQAEAALIPGLRKALKAIN